MPRSDSLSADSALLVGLSAVVSVMIGFGLLMYGLMQPTVLPNAPFAMIGQEKRAAIIPRAAPQSLAPDVEQSAIAVAERENDIQGLRPIAVANAEPATSPAQPTNKTAKVSKPRRVVARAPKQDARRAFASNWWGGHGPSQMFGGFGSWYR
jgi:hypothetical protein